MKQTHERAEMKRSKIVDCNEQSVLFNGNNTTLLIINHMLETREREGKRDSSNQRFNTTLYCHFRFF